MAEGSYEGTGEFSEMDGGAVTMESDVPALLLDGAEAFSVIELDSSRLVANCRLASIGVRHD